MKRALALLAALTLSAVNAQSEGMTDLYAAYVGLNVGPCLPTYERLIEGESVDEVVCGTTDVPYIQDAFVDAVYFYENGMTNLEPWTDIGQGHRMMGADFTDGWSVLIVTDGTNVLIVRAY